MNRDREAAQQQEQQQEQQQDDDPRRSRFAALLRRAQASADATLARGLLWRLSLALLLSIGLLAWLVHGVSSRELRAKSLEELRLGVAERARAGGADFAIAQANTEMLRDEYLRRLAAPKPKDWQAQFSKWFARWPDQLLRVRPELDDHRRLPSVYLRPQVALDDAVMWQTQVAFGLLREWGPPMTARYYSAYFDLPAKGLIMFSPSVNWGAEANAQSNNFDYPPVAGAAPDKNPRRRNQWTPVYYDDKARIYMVSTVTPIDYDGEWIACVSQDVAVDSLLKRTLGEALPGSYNMLISKDRHLIAHPNLSAKIEAAQGNLALASLSDPLLNEIADLSLPAPGEAIVSASRDGRHMLALARIPGPDWLFVSVYPTALLAAEADKIAANILLAGAVVWLVLMSLLGWIVRRQISRPITALQSAVRGVADGRFDITLPIQRADELGQLGNAFIQMGEELGRREMRLRDDARELERGRALLETRVQERTAALHASTTELSETLFNLSQTQSSLMRAERLASLGRLVAGVAHEMGTPVGNARLASSTLSAEADAMESALKRGMRRSELDGFVKRVGTGAHILQANIERVSELLLSFKQVAVDSSSAQRRHFELAQLVQQILLSMAPSIKRMPVEVLVDIPAGLEMDSYPGALGQVLTNLIANALVHGLEGREHGRIEIRAKRIGDAGGQAEMVRLCVSDDGVGIPADIQARVFDPFFTTRMGRGGTGLGLNISHNLVSNVLCGTLSLQSINSFSQGNKESGGTRFVIELPLVAPSGAVGDTILLPDL